MTTNTMNNNDDVEVGPSLPKKLKTNSENTFETLLSRLPIAKRYELSFMHREIVTHVGVTKTNFAITASADGYVKFWRLQREKDAEFVFVKMFKAHEKLLSGFALSRDGLLFASASDSDDSLRFYDVVNFDMTLYLELPFSPSCCKWIHREGKDITGIIAVADKNKPEISIYSNESISPLKILKTIHNSPVSLMSYNSKYKTVISADRNKMMEYWSSIEPYSFPESIVNFNFKIDTDLYCFKKADTQITSLEFSPDFEQFVTFSVDQKIRVWNFKEGVILQTFDENMAIYEDIQINADILKENKQSEESKFILESFDYGQRAAREHIRLNLLEDNDILLNPNVIFDESGELILYSTIYGIKILSVKNGKCVRLLGKEESSERFLKIALSPSNPTDFGNPAIKSYNKQSILSEEAQNPAAQLSRKLICTSFQKNRFYVFSNREPSDSLELEGKSRDIVNEKLADSAMESSIRAKTKKTQSVKKVTLFTTLGDITLSLYSDLCPKTVENFIGLVRKKYYNGLIFHRVVQNFIVQTGDPTGTGSGGSSIWGKDFADEIVDSLRHDNPGVVSMANSGKNTNGSQFFITLRAAPWLDEKHTVFGRVEKGMGVVFEMGDLPVDKREKPRDPPKIIKAKEVL